MEPPPPQAGDQAEGVRLVGHILRSAPNARWPMYLRNVKQILRAADGGFDERQYGFGGLMDLLRACQREWPGPRRARSPRRPARVSRPGPPARRGGTAARAPESVDADAQPSESNQATGWRSRNRSTPSSRSRLIPSTRPRNCLDVRSQSPAASACRGRRGGRGRLPSRSRRRGARERRRKPSSHVRREPDAISVAVEGVEPLTHERLRGPLP